MARDATMMDLRERCECFGSAALDEHAMSLLVTSVERVRGFFACIAPRASA
jgi:hypothetical protein